MKLWYLLTKKKSMYFDVEDFSVPNKKHQKMPYYIFSLTETKMYNTETHPVSTLLCCKIELNSLQMVLTFAFNQGGFISLKKPIEPVAFPSAKNNRKINKILRCYACTIPRNAVCSPWVHNAWCRASQSLCTSSSSGFGMPSKTSDYYFQSVFKFKMAMEKVISDDK